MSHSHISPPVPRVWKHDRYVTGRLPEMVAGFNVWSCSQPPVESLRGISVSAWVHRFTVLNMLRSGREREREREEEEEEEE